MCVGNSTMGVLRKQSSNHYQIQVLAFQCSFPYTIGHYHLGRACLHYICFWCEGSVLAALGVEPFAFRKPRAAITT